MGRNLKLEDKFTFSCHDQLACFKKCCRDINIFLTPYDVLRMRKKMQISSGDFLNKHTHVLKSPHSGFPVVILKMREDDLVCPFITDKGCQVYDVRPWSCRMAPVEVRGTGEFGIAFEESRCHG
ncbi:YkgJ family cysteine cluster protein [Desulforamulus profundi]|uniref:YkgJ family cysteine cluster protein n=1 Tax=Desulforamulus profundi TaxID=1383067 RepID=UPI003082EB7B